MTSVQLKQLLIHRDATTMAMHANGVKHFASLELTYSAVTAQPEQHRRTLEQELQQTYASVITYIPNR